jgi:hypothetical protein
MIQNQCASLYNEAMRPKSIHLVLVLAASTVALAVVGCGGGGSSSADVISPSGAPYSYTVPSGFEEIAGEFPEGETPEFLTLVVPNGTEGQGYLNAYEWTLGWAEKAYSTKQMLGYLDQSTQSFYASEGASVTPGKDETVAGKPAVCWKLSHFKNETEGLVDGDSCAIVAAPGVAVEQSCSWKPATRAAMEKGCEELRASLELKPPAES